MRHAPQVELRTTGDRASYAGLVTCGAVWLCPPCQAKIAAYRALEIAAVTERAQSAGVPMLFGALTLQHTRDDSLADLLALLRESWRSMTSGREWQSIKADAGGLHIVRTLEVNDGANGWHPHQHPLLILGEGAAVESIADRIVDRWIASVTALGGTASPRAQALTRVLNAPDVGAYIADQTFGGKSTRARLDMEMTNSQGKAGLSRMAGTRSHWGIIDDLARGEGVAVNLAKYYQLEAYTRRVRQIGWSRAVRAWAGLGAEWSDEQLAAAPEGALVAYLHPAGYERLHELGLALTSLELLEAEGWEAVANFWQMHGVAYSMEAEQ